jgi:hypothetical protein
MISPLSRVKITSYVDRQKIQTADARKLISLDPESNLALKNVQSTVTAKSNQRTR